jgi:hypothetical protein
LIGGFAYKEICHVVELQLIGEACSVLGFDKAFVVHVGMAAGSLFFGGGVGAVEAQAVNFEGSIGVLHDRPPTAIVIRQAGACLVDWRILPWSPALHR